MVGIGSALRFLTGGFLCPVARALAAATMPSGFALPRLGGWGGNSGEDDRGFSNRENGFPTWFVFTLYIASCRRVRSVSTF